MLSTPDFQAKDQSPSPLQTSLLWSFMDVNDRRGKREELIYQLSKSCGPCLVGLKIEMQGEKQWKYTWETAKINSGSISGNLELKEVFGEGELK